MNKIPNAFWAFYDLYRRKIITLDEFAKKTNIDKKLLQVFLRQISKE